MTTARKLCLLLQLDGLEILMIIILCPLNKFEEGYCNWMGYDIDLVEHMEERHREDGIQSQPTFASVTMGNEKCVVKLSEDTFIYYKCCMNGHNICDDIRRT